MDDTDRLALAAPSLKTEQRVVSIMTAEREVVPWYKQIFEGSICQECKEDKSDKKSLKTVQEAYCTTCYHTGIVGGYQSYRHVRLLDVYIEWGGKPTLFSSGALQASVDFEYHITPGDFFELGKLEGDVVFRPDAGVGERNTTKEGVPCLWRVLDVTVISDGDIPLFWEIQCRSVETFEPLFGWLVNQNE